MSIAITGATGQLGSIIIEKLKQVVDPVSIVAVVRNLEKANSLEVTAREADYESPTQLEKAFQDIETILLISSSAEEGKARHHQNVIDAAVKANVKRIVYTSLLHTLESPIKIAEDHIETEKALKNSGLETTILRNGWYTENYIDFFIASVNSGVLYGCAGEGKYSSATRSDYADAAVKVLTEKGHENKIYELAGDTSYTLSNVAQVISELSGKNVIYQNFSEENYIVSLENIGLSKIDSLKIANFDAAAEKGALFDESKQLSKLIGHPTEKMELTLKKILG